MKIRGNLEVGKHISLAGQLQSPFSQVASLATTAIIDWNDGNVSELDLAAATGTVILTLDNPKLGASYELHIIQHATVPVAVTFPVEVDSPIDISSVASGNRAVVSWTYDGTSYLSSGESSPLTVKGDIYTYDTGNQKLAIGTDGYTLTADAAEPTGLKWALVGGGDMFLASAQTNSGIKTFLDTTMKLRNVANTYDAYFINTNTADRIYTLPDTTGTIALISDLTYWAVAGITTTTSGQTTSIKTSTAANSVIELTANESTGDTETIRLSSNGEGLQIESKLFSNTARGTFIDSYAGAMSINIANPSTGVSTAKFQFESSSQTIKFSDSRGTTVGLEYAGDYTSDFGIRSLIDRGFSDSAYLLNGSASSIILDTTFNVDDVSLYMYTIPTAGTSQIYISSSNSGGAGRGYLSVSKNLAGTDANSIIGGQDANGQMAISFGYSSTYGDGAKFFDSRTTTVGLEYSANYHSGFGIRSFIDREYWEIDQSATAVLHINNIALMSGDSGAGGTKGLVPAQISGDAVKFLQGDGTWADPGGASPLTTKGDLFTYSTVDDRLAVAVTDGWVLSIDSAEATGLKWIALPGGGDMLLGTVQTVTAAKTFKDGTFKIENVTQTFIGNYTNTNTADRTYFFPDFSGDVLLTTATQIVTGITTFNDTTLLLRNVAGTFNGSFVNTNTANRIYTLQDNTGTIAFLSDITGINSGTNTGDQDLNIQRSDSTTTYSTLTSDKNTTVILTAAGAVAITLDSAGKSIGYQVSILNDTGTSATISRGTDTTIQYGTGVLSDLLNGEYFYAELTSATEWSVLVGTGITSIVGILGTKAEYNTSLTDGDFMYIGDAPTVHVHGWSDITTGVPTTISGYGITDSYTKTESDNNYWNISGTNIISSPNDTQTHSGSIELSRLQISDTNPGALGNKNIGLWSVGSDTGKIAVIDTKNSSGVLISTILVYDGAAKKEIYLSSSGTYKGILIRESWDNVGLYYDSDFSSNGVIEHPDRWIPDVGYTNSRLIGKSTATIDALNTNTGPGVTEDQYSLTWDNIAGEYLLVPTSGDMLLGTSQVVTASKTFNDGTLILAGLSSGTTTIKANSSAGTTTATLQAATGTLAYLTDIPTNYWKTDGNTSVTGVATTFIEAAGGTSFAGITIGSAPSAETSQAYISLSHGGGTNPQVTLRVFNATDYTGIFVASNVISMQWDDGSNKQGLWSSDHATRKGMYIGDEIDNVGLSYNNDYSVQGIIERGNRWISDKGYNDATYAPISITGTVTGTGTDNQVAIWNGTDDIDALGAGTNTYVLTMIGGIPAWAAASGGGNVATDVIWDAAADLLVGTGANAGTRLAKGTGLQVLRMNAGATAIEWGAPSGGGDMLLGTSQVVTALKTFNNGTFALRNVANTFNGSFVNTNLVDRTYTLQDADGTIAFLTDINLNIQRTEVGTTYSTLTSDKDTTVVLSAAGAVAITLDSTGKSIGYQVTIVNNTSNTATVSKGTDSTIQAGAIPDLLHGEYFYAELISSNIWSVISAEVAGTGDALVANPLSQFAATTSLQLKGVMSDETGSGALVFATSPTFITPALGTPASGVMTNVTGYPGDSSLITVGTIATGVWQGTAINQTYLVDQSGTNTGDQTSIVGITGTKAQFNIANTEGSFMYVGDAPTAHTHLLAAGATDVTATFGELNLLDLAGLTAGWVLSADTATTASWKAPSGGGASVGANNEIQSSDGAGGFVASKLFADETTGFISLGDSGLAGAERKISSVGSAAVINLSYESKGASSAHSFGNDTLSRAIEIAGVTIKFKDGGGSASLESGYVSLFNQDDALRIRTVFGSTDYLKLNHNSVHGSNGLVLSSSNANLSLFTSDKTTVDNAFNVTIKGGDSVDGTAGNVTLEAGNATGTGADGEIVFRGTGLEYGKWVNSTLMIKETLGSSATATNYYSIYNNLGYLYIAHASINGIRITASSAAEVSINATATDSDLKFYANGIGNILLTGQNLGINGSSFADMEGGLFIGDVTTVPTTNPTGGGLLYVSGTSLNYRDDAGTVTDLTGSASGDMVLAGIQNVTGAKTFGTIGGAVDKFILAGSTSGSSILNAAAVAGTTTLTLPGVTGTLMTNLVEDTTPQLGGELDMQAHSIGGTAQTATGDGATTIDWKLGNMFNFLFLVATTEVFTFTAPTKPGTFMLKLKQPATGTGEAATWPGTVKWSGGTAPTLSTGNDAEDIITFYYDGSNYYAVEVLNLS